jgi:hypothetical protein
MLLSMDKKGNVYQAASHRSDGLGFEDVAEVVDEKDVYYEGAALETSRQINAANQSYEKFNLIEKMREDQVAFKNERLKKNARKINALIDEVNINPDVQEALRYEGIIQNMDKSADFNQLEISGYGLSSDGIIGPSPREKAVEIALRQQMGETIPVAEYTYAEEATYDVGQAEKEAAAMEEAYKRKSLIAAEREYLKQPDQYVVNPAAVKALLPPLEADLSGKEVATQATSFLSQIKPIHLALAGLAILLLRRK